MTRRDLGTARARQGEAELPAGDVAAWVSPARRSFTVGQGSPFPLFCPHRYQVDVGLPGGQRRVDNQGCRPPALPAAGAASGHSPEAGQHFTVPTGQKLEADDLHSESVSCRVF